MTTKTPFYPCVPEDRFAFSLMNKGMLDPIGNVVGSSLDSLKDSSFQLDLESLETIQQLFNKNFPIEGRCRSISFNIETSMKEIALSMDRIAQNKVGQHLNIILDGGCLWSLLKPFILRIFTTWITNSQLTKSIDEVITPIFRSILDAAPNDYDWQLYTKTADKGINQSLIDEGMVKPLAEKFKLNSFNPSLLVYELAKSKRYSGNQPKQSYLYRVLRDYSMIDVKQSDLHNLFFSVFGFLTAADVDDNEVCFSLRSIGSSQLSHDLLLPVQVRRTITPINSLFVNVTSLLQNNAFEGIYLNSFLGGKEMIIQTFSDKNLSIMTFNDSAIADRLDFVRTFSHFTQGGRCYQEGWLEKTLNAFLEEKEKQQIPLSQLLSKQLISRTIHHHGGKTTVLFALTFNVSCFLLWKNRDYSSEIQQLWKKIFEYIDTRELKAGDYQLDSLIDHIQKFMRLPDSSFEDLYAQVQVSSSIHQNCISDGKHNYLCEPTQTEGELYTQIKLPTLKNSSEKRTTFDHCTLFFPYDLPQAIKHIKRLSRIALSTLQRLDNIHNTIISNNVMSFGFEKSRLKEFNWDFRRELHLCRINALDLLCVKQEQAWQMGVLLSLSILAQKKEDFFLKEFLKKFTTMLLSSWVTDRFKKEVTLIFNRMLENSFISIEEPLFQKWNKLSIIRDLLSYGEDAFVSVGLKYLDEHEKELDYDSLVTVYSVILMDCIEKNSLQECHAPQKSLQNIIWRIGIPNKFLVKTSLQWLTKLYHNESVTGVKELEEALFDSTFSIFAKQKSLSKQEDKAFQVDLTHLSMQIIQRPERLLKPFKSLRFAREIYRLEVLKDNDSKTSFKSALMTIFEKLSGKEDINLVSLEKEFGISADTIKHRYLKSLPLLKSSIENRVRYLQDGKSSTEEMDILFSLLRELISRSVCWEERSFIFKTLVQFSKAASSSENLTEINDLIEKFHDSQPETAFQDMVCLYLDWLGQGTYSFSSAILKLAITLLGASKGNFKDEHYKSCNRYLLKISSMESDFKIGSDSILENYLRQLGTRELWNEVIDFYAVKPLLHPDYATHFTEILIKACQSLIAKKNDKEVVKKLNQILTKIPDVVLDHPAWRVKIKDLFLSFYTESIKEKDLIGAMKWLRKLELYREFLDGGYYKRAFEVIFLLLKNRCIREAEMFIGKLSTPLGFEPFWMKTFQILLQEGYITSGLNFLENKKDLLGMKQSVFYSQWTEILGGMIVQTYEISKACDESSITLLKKMIEVNHELIGQCQPKTSKLWLLHIDSATRFASIKLVEEILHLLVVGAKEGRLPLTKYERVSCWKWTLERLSKESSKVFFHTSKWWPTIWEEFKFEEKKERQELVSMLINGTAKAIEPPLMQNGEMKCLNRNLSQQMINGSKTVAELIDTDEVMFFLDDSLCHTTMLNFSKILWATKIDKYVDRATKYLGVIFLISEYDPIEEQQTIQLFNEFLEVAGENTNLSLTIFSLISVIQQSSHSDVANHFGVLNYLQKITSKGVNYTTRKQIRFKNEITYSWICETIKDFIENPGGIDIFKFINYLHDIPSSSLGNSKNEQVNVGREVSLFLIKKAIQELLVIPWKISSIDKKNKTLFQNSLKRLSQSSPLKELEFVKWCLQQKNLYLYADKAFINELESYIKSIESKVQWIPYKMAQITQNFFDVLSLYQGIKERKRVLESNEIGNRFRLLEAEKKVVDRVRVALILTVVIVSAFTLVIFNSIGTRSSSK